MTGNVCRFINKLKMNCIKITDDLVVQEKFILVTYTIGLGKIPESTKLFLYNNHEYMQGVSASGNKIWGNTFALSANVISLKYNVPLISKFELSGTKKDVENFREKVEQIVANTKVD